MRADAGPHAVPLFVDVDATLVRADVTLESLVRVMRSGVAGFLAGLWWLLSGRAVVKALLARRAPVDPASLPYRGEVMDLIARAKADGRPVILASASHWRNVSRIARHIGADGVIATRRRNNLKGADKLAAIRTMMGDAPFDYVGDCDADAVIWRAARNGFNAGRKLHRDVQPLANPPRGWFAALLIAMRPHQWAKNLLVFVPLATAGLIADPVAIMRAAGAAAGLSLLASAIYIINDLLDIDADRRHRKKRFRPLAAGDMTIAQALPLSGALAIAGLGIGALAAGLPVLTAMLAYAAMTIAYSLKIKAAMVADVLMLAALYTVRIWIGAVAVDVVLSQWLLMFSIFFFLSLGYLKRYVELRDSDAPEHKLLSGRGYVAGDLDLVMVSGVSAGLCSILILALFANDVAATAHYSHPKWLWVACVPLLYWINRVWIMARRGEVDGDPVAFALKDTRSLALGVVTGLIFLAALKFPA